MKINLTKEQCEDIIRVCESIIKTINKNMESEQYSTIILQGLTAEQEDYIIEAELEHIRAERELQKDIFNKEAKELL